ncbi:MAG: sodium:solute symporter [Prevotella sp.]|nr:sodium:solute symporter [Prevotella sp.]
MIIIGTILAYFSILLLISWLTGHKADNDAFFRANGKSPWYLVAFGMVGASISGVTFVSVPGMVLASNMTYMQTCLGFILGYFAVAFLLLPVYYHLRLTTIYSYLQMRLGLHSYRTGASFFLLSKMTGAAVRFYVVCMILQRFVLDGYGVPFPVTVVTLVMLIWLYTRRGGIRTLVLTDTFQTFCMLLALLLIIYKVVGALGMDLATAVQTVVSDSHSRVFVFDDWISRQNFWKQFLSGVFIVIVMTGLDQDMMQKNLTCKTLREAQKDMCSYGFAFAPANLLFLSLGVLLMMYFYRTGQPLPAVPDELMLQAVASGQLGTLVVILFTVGIVAACFSSADSALTALTTSFCVDICNRPKNERLRKGVHVGMSVVFALFILMFRIVNSTSLIDAIYILCSYTYGPLLGLFAFGLLTKRRVNDRLVPYVAVGSPLACFALDTIVSHAAGYKFGYELLMLNGMLTFVGLCLISGGSMPKILSSKLSLNEERSGR